MCSHFCGGFVLINISLHPESFKCKDTWFTLSTHEKLVLAKYFTHLHILLLPIVLRHRSQIWWKLSTVFNSCLIIKWLVNISVVDWTISICTVNILLWSKPERHTDSWTPTLILREHRLWTRRSVLNLRLPMSDQMFISSASSRPRLPLRERHARLRRPPWE